MKHFRLLILLLGIALLCGCTGRLGSDGMQFYYLCSEVEYNSPSGVITPVTANGVDRSAPLDQILEQYLSGPDNDGLLSPFPEETKLLSVEQKDDTIYLVFNARLGSLTGMDLTLACACLTMTCLDLTDAANVSIRAEGAMLDGAQQITMNADSLVLLDSTQ